MQRKEKIITQEKLPSLMFSGREFSDLCFERCTFFTSDFTKARFSSCSFLACNLHMVQMQGCRLQDVSFVECKIVGGEFFRVDPWFFSIKCLRCVLMGCNFSRLKMKKTNFSGSKLRQCFFQEACLEEASFQEADLSGSLFHQTDLTKADFKDAKNYALDPRSNSLKKARFSLPEALSLLSFLDVEIL